MKHHARPTFTPEQSIARLYRVGTFAVRGDELRALRAHVDALPPGDRVRFVLNGFDFTDAPLSALYHVLPRALVPEELCALAGLFEEAAADLRKRAKGDE